MKFAFSPLPVATLDDWKSIEATPVDQLSETQAKASLDVHRKKVEISDNNTLQKADALGIETNAVLFTLDEVRRAGANGTTRGALTRMTSADFLEFVRISVTGKSTDAKLNGQYELTLQRAVKYPKGWRVEEGVAWKKFPAGAVNAKVLREMQILEKVAKRQPITGEDDPALQAWAQAVLKFVQQRDIKIFENEVLLSIDKIYAFLSAGAPPGRLPPKEQFAIQWKEHSKALIQSAAEMLSQAEKFEVDLKEAEVSLKEVAAANAMSRRGAGTIVGLEANTVEIVFTSKTDRKTSKGKALAGEYRIGAGELMNLGGEWFLQEPIRWSQFPSGIVSKEDKQALEVENHVAKHGRLPPGYKAPDAEIVKLADNTKAKLADYRGKVLVLDFWATWCGPCQQPMAELQKVVQQHPEWKDKVVFMSLSIDKDVEKLKAHLAKKEWTNSFNAWAGPGEWQASAAKAYRVTGVPSSYVIDAKGVITWSGHPGGTDLGQHIKEALK